MNPIIELYQEDITQLGPPLSVSLILVKKTKNCPKKSSRFHFSLANTARITLTMIALTRKMFVLRIDNILKLYLIYYFHNIYLFEI